MSLKDSLVVFTEGAKVNFNLYGHLVPVFAGMLDGKPQIFQIVWNSPEEKTAFAKKVQGWIAENRLTEYIMVCEAWTARIEDGEQSKVQDWLNSHGSLQNWPNGGEIALVSYCSAKEEIECTAEIIRGTISSLGEWKTNHREVKFDIVNFTTRFQSLFFKGKAGQN